MKKSRKLAILVSVMFVVLLSFNACINSQTRNELTKDENTDFISIEITGRANLDGNVYCIASDTHTSDIDTWVAANDHLNIYASRDGGTGYYGSFEVTSGNDIDFFICDEENYNLWVNGQSASVYLLQQRIGSYSWSFRIPHTDTWHFIYSNEYSIVTSKHVVGDQYIDHTPPTINSNLYSGINVDGLKSITAEISDAHFSVQEVNLRIDGVIVHKEYDSSFSYSWDTSQVSNGYHTLRITASDNVGNSGYQEFQVYVSNAVTSSSTANNPNTSNPYNPNTSNPDLPASEFPIAIPFTLGIVGIIAFISIGAIYMKKRGGNSSPIAPISRPPPPSDDGVSHSAKQTSDEEESYLDQQTPVSLEKIACPFCGSKIDKGLTKCTVCGADL